MTGQSQNHREDDHIREVYEEFEVGDATVAMISDPRADDAWIQSDVTRLIEP